MLRLSRGQRFSSWTDEKEKEKRVFCEKGCVIWRGGCGTLLNLPLSYRRQVCRLTLVLLYRHGDAFPVSLSIIRCLSIASGHPIRLGNFVVLNLVVGQTLGKKKKSE